MLSLTLILLILFLIGLTFYWLFKLIFKRKKHKKYKKHKIPEYKSEFKTSDLITDQKFLFMDDYRMWKNLSHSEKKERLKDIQLILDYGEDHITKAMIKKGFQPGSKIIDIKYFTGLNQFGYTISSFLIQHENGGEIRALTINIDLDKMEFIPTNNHFHSNGKEKYWYMRHKNKDLINI